MIKEKLIEAVKSAASDYNGGTGADMAVAKAAEAWDFNDKQTDRLVEMFNTALALGQEKSASDPTGTCELADKGNVAKILIESSCRTKKASSSDGVDYSFYSSDPVKTNASIESRRMGMESLTKSASPAPDAIAPELNVSQRSLYKVIEEKIGLLKRAAEAADEVARNLVVEADEGVVKISKAIEHHNADDRLADMFKAACQCKEAVRLVSEYSTKVAESDGGEFAKAHVFDTSPVEDLLKEAQHVESCLSDISEYERKRDYYLSKAAEAESEIMSAVGIEAAYEKKASLADMFTGECHAPNEGGVVKGCTEPDEAGMCMKIAEMLRDSDLESEDIAKLAEELEKGAAPLTGVVPMPSLSESYGALVAKPGIDNERKRIMNVRRSIILAELMSKDPIIRDADPNTVVEAYKTMVMTSPRVSLDKAQVRAFLRSAVNSVAISPSDAKVLADVDRGTGMSNVDRITSIDSSIKDSNVAV